MHPPCLLSQIALRPDWAKGFSRKGAALYGLHRWTEAVATYQAGLAFEPDNAQMKQAIADIEDRLKLARTLFEAVSEGARCPRLQGCAALARL